MKDRSGKVAAYRLLVEARALMMEAQDVVGNEYAKTGSTAGVGPRIADALIPLDRAIDLVKTGGEKP